jgi:Zn finger protein HypA/HybF involved in hydrogenase expression
MIYNNIIIENNKIKCPECNDGYLYISNSRKKSMHNKNESIIPSFGEEPNKIKCTCCGKEFEVIITNNEDELIKLYINSGADISRIIKSKVEDKVDTVTKQTVKTPCELTQGKRFKIRYYKHSDIYNRTPLKDCVLVYIEGEVQNFNPQHEVAIYDEKYGFHIIPYRAIAYMEEIKNI